MSLMTHHTKPSHLNALQAKHNALALRIEREEQRPAADFDAIRQLKAEKLRLKDMILELHEAEDTVLMAAE